MDFLRREFYPRVTGLSVQLATGKVWHPGCRKGKFSVYVVIRQVGAKSALMVVFLSLALPARTWGQVEGYPQLSRKLSFVGAVSPVYRFKANVDGGGTLSVTSVYFNAGVIRQLNQKLGLGLSFTYEFDDYNFSGLTGFPVSRPWKEIQRLGFSIPIFYSLTDQWKLVIVPTAQFSGEFGAKVDQALVYGGAVGVSYAFGPKVTLGLGVAGYANLEEARVFPFPIVK